MPKRISKPKRDSRDVNQIAYDVVTQATAETPTSISRSIRSQVMAEMGRKGGKKGGKRRLVTMTAEERTQLALRAAQARWKKRAKA